jgi:hypothetical protein
MRIPRALKQNKVRFATADDFLGIFTGEMHSLFLLALLLTADPEIAVQCFVSGLEECVYGMDSFVERAIHWARRSVVKHAIRLIKPAQIDNQRPLSTCLNWPATQETNNIIRALWALNAFERFAFVMSLLERQSDQDCSLLLGCRQREFKEARERAISSLSRSDHCRNLDDESQTAPQPIWLRQKTETDARLVA